MKIQETKQGVILEVYVKPKSNDFKIMVDDGEIVAFCSEEPVKGKADKELIKELSRLFHRKVQLISGFTSNQKKLLIRDAEKSEIERVFLRK